MIFRKTFVEELFEIQTLKKGDSRGWFIRTYDFRLFQENIPSFCGRWVQMNHSFNSKKYTWRGFHFQNAPHQESKLVRCISGRVLDCVLDLREHSKSFLEIFKTELSADNDKMLYIPKGCAHGFLTLEKDSELIYMHDEYYIKNLEFGVRYNDQKIKLNLLNIL